MNFLTAEALPGWRGRAGLTVDLRPESIAIHAGEIRDGGLPVRLLLSEMAGSTMILHCDSRRGD